MLLDSAEAFLLVVDVQMKLAPVVQSSAASIANIETLVRAARRLNVPMLACEQYPKGLGRAVPDLATLLPRSEIMEKVHFSCMDEHQCANQIKAINRRQAIVCGMETHVCVLQTAMSLIEAGYRDILPLIK